MYGENHNIISYYNRSAKNENGTVCSTLNFVWEEVCPKSWHKKCDSIFLTCIESGRATDRGTQTEAYD